MKIRAALLLKAPILGTVKTRLAVSLGAEEAKRIYIQLVEWQLSQIPDSWGIDIHFTPPTARKQLEEWISPLRTQKISFFPQPEGDLGVRLRAALQNSLSQGADRVALMGGDCPDLTKDYLQISGERSNSFDVTVAPTFDGGYALLILNHDYPELFQNIPWSTSTVYSDTKQAMKQLLLSSCDLATVDDIDDLDSLQRNQQKLTTANPKNIIYC